MGDNVPQLIRAAALSSLLIETLGELDRDLVSGEQVQTLRDLSGRLAIELDRSARARELAARLNGEARQRREEHGAEGRRANVIPLPSRP